MEVHVLGINKRERRICDLFRIATGVFGEQMNDCEEMYSVGAAAVGDDGDSGGGDHNTG
jgi:hypothetical protein